MKYGYLKELKTGFIEALDDVEIALKTQGFGILSKIDLQSTMKNKLDKDIEEYMIYGACNPGLAYEALGEEYEIGLVLPCNVIIYKKNSKIFVSSINPTVGIGFIENKQIQIIAKKAEEKLKLALDNI